MELFTTALEDARAVIAEKGDHGQVSIRLLAAVVRYADTMNAENLALRRTINDLARRPHTTKGEEDVTTPRLCPACGAVLTFARHETSGSWMPLVEATPEERANPGAMLWRIDDRPRDGPRAVRHRGESHGNLFGETIYVSHFANCPEAERYRRRPERSP